MKSTRKNGLRKTKTKRVKTAYLRDKAYLVFMAEQRALYPDRFKFVSKKVDRTEKPQKYRGVIYD